MSDTRRSGLSQLSASEGKRFGLPENFKYYTAAPFAGMNQEDARTAMEDPEFFWLENLLLTGKGYLTALYDRGSPLWTATSGKKIIYGSSFAINGITAFALFLDDGTALQVTYPGGVVTWMATTPGLFYGGGQLPCAVQSGSRFLVISNNNSANSYWIWDGSVLYGAGGVGPFDNTDDLTDPGSGYTSAPTCTIFGGSGTGATVDAVVSDGSVVALIVTNPGTGYTPADSQVQVAFSGGGSDNSAILIAVLTGGNVDHVELISGGAGYSSAPTITVSGGGGGSGFAATATVSGGAVTAITITDHGSGYTSTPTLGFSGGGGSGAAAIAVLSSGTVASVTVVNGGTGFTGTPTLTFTGGGGTGATATATITSGAISSVTVTAGGSGYTSPPAVVVQTGLNNAAAANLDLMPFGVSGSCMEMYQSRVWLANPYQVGPFTVGGVLNVGAPGSLTDFSNAGGGVQFTNNSRYLRQSYTALHQSNGFLYPFGDSSVDNISNVQTGGSPTTTTFNNYTTNTQIGVAWRDTVVDFNQSVLFANRNGGYGLYGGSVQKISKKLNRVFAQAVWPPTAGAVTPSGAVVNLQTIPVYLLNITLVDPRNGQQRTVMLAWDERNWIVVSQSSPLTFITTLEVDSKMTAWGTDGTSWFQLLVVPSSNIPKAFSTKLFAGERQFLVKEPMAVYLRVTDNTTAQGGISGTITIEASGAAQQIGQRPQPPFAINAPNSIQPNMQAPAGALSVWAGIAEQVPGTAIGMSFTSNAPDFTVEDIGLAYQEIAAIFG